MHLLPRIGQAFLHHAPSQPVCAWRGGGGGGGGDSVCMSRGVMCVCRVWGEGVCVVCGGGCV